jgi:hypothetical protein
VERARGERSPFLYLSCPTHSLSPCGGAGNSTVNSGQPHERVAVRPTCGHSPSTDRFIHRSPTVSSRPLTGLSRTMCCEPLC